MPAILDFLQEHKVDHSTTHHHSRPGWVQIKDCPFCHSSNYHLGITLDGRRASCYKCGAHNVRKALQIASGASWGVVKALSPEVQQTLPERIYGGYRPPRGIVPLTNKDREYLVGPERRLDLGMVLAHWNLQSVGPLAGLPFGVFIPITHKGRPVSWTIRFRNAEDQRYKTATDHEKEMSEKELLFGAEYCTGTIIAVEGPFDMMRIGPGAGCMFGLQYSRKQVHALSKYHNRVICFDNSVDAQNRAAVLADELSGFPGTTRRIQLDADDPGSASDHEIALLRKEAGLPV